MGLGKTYSTKYLADSNNNTGVAGQVLSTTSTGIDWADVNTLPGAGIWIENGNDIYNSNSGNVGINITGPGALLQIGTRGTAAALSIPNTNGILFDFYNNGNPYTRHASIISQASDLTEAVIDFYTKPLQTTYAAATKKVTIRGNGNVGIGTDDPGAKLNVAGDILVNSGEYISWGTVGASSIEGSTVSNKLQFRTNSSDSMIIDADGNVGIGTTGPNNLLELYKTVNSDIGPILQLTNSQYTNANDSGSSIQFRGYTLWGPGSSNPRYSEINAINGSGSVPKRIEFKFYADTNVKTPLSILQTGRVGVGTTTPGNVFVVESAASASAAEFINTNADANPSGIVLKKLSTSPADEDVLGRIIFQGNNDDATPALRTFARIETKATNVTDGNEDGELSFWTSKNAAQSKKLLISPEGAVQSKTSGNIILNYRSGSAYSYTGGTLYNNWNKIGTFTAPGNSSRIFTEILAKGDNNYPYWMKGTVMVSFYSTGVSVSCQTDGGYEGGHNFQCIVTKDGTTYDVWVRVPTIEWSSFVQYRTLNNSGFTENYVFTIASGNVSNSAPTGADDETPAIEPNSSYRFNISDLQTPNQTYNSNKFLVNGDTNVVFSPTQNYFTQKVGIGETLPQEMLDVGGNIVMDASNARLKIKSGVTGTSGGVDWTFNSASTQYARIDLAYDTRASTGLLIDSGYPMTLDYSSGSFSVKKNGSSELTITSGKVGIGTTTNTTIPLHVNQTGSGTIFKASGIAATIEIQSATAGPASLYMRPNITGDQSADFRMTANYTNFSGSWRWTDDTSGSSPGVFMKLQQSNGTLTVTGDLVAYGSPSDKKLKENIKPIESALDKVTKLQGVTFDWKESDSILDIKEDIGFIAQDVQKVVPELVRKNKDGMLSMRHQGIAPILLEAIKELKAEIDLLKSKPCTCNKCNCNI